MGISINLKKAVGKTKTRSQMCLIGTDDGRIVDMEILVLKGCTCEDATCNAWLQDASNQFQEESSGKWYQVLSERSTIPICSLSPTKVKDLKKRINEIFHESWIMDLVQANREAAKNKVKSWLLIILGIPIILGAIFLGISLLGR